MLRIVRNLEKFESDLKNSFTGINIELLSFPKIGTEAFDKYCSAMKGSPDYEKICGIFSQDDKSELSDRSKITLTVVSNTMAADLGTCVE